MGTTERAQLERVAGSASAPDESSRWKRNVLFIAVFVLVCALWAASWLLTSRFLPAWDVRGNFGDMFGAVGSLFSGLALAGLVITLYLQSKQLTLQHQALLETREQIQKERFESTFFQLLSLHNEIVAAMSLRDESLEQEHVGRTCLKYLLNKLYGMFESDGRSAEQIYGQFFSENRAELELYYGSLLRILNFVNDRGGAGQSFYIGIVQSQFSTSERSLLFYHCLSSDGGRLKPVVRQNNLLSDLLPGDLILPQHYESFSEFRRL